MQIQLYIYYENCLSSHNIKANKKTLTDKSNETDIFNFIHLKLANLKLYDHIKKSNMLYKGPYTIDQENGIVNIWVMYYNIKNCITYQDFIFLKKIPADQPIVIIVQKENILSIANFMQLDNDLMQKIINIEYNHISTLCESDILDGYQIEKYDYDFT